MAARWPQNGRRGLERGLTLGYWTLSAILDKAGGEVLGVAGGAELQAVSECPLRR